MNFAWSRDAAEVDTSKIVLLFSVLLFTEILKYNDIKEGDQLEVFVMEEVPR